MAWVAGVVGVVAFIYFMIRFESFRGIVILLAVGIGGYVWWDNNENKKRTQLAETLIPKSQVHLTDTRLSIGSLGELTGKVRNSSTKYTLSGLTLKITIRDCPTKKSISKGCDIVGENEVYSRVTIPPGQVRSISEYVSFYDPCLSG